MTTNSNDVQEKFNFRGKITYIMNEKWYELACKINVRCSVSEVKEMVTSMIAKKKVSYNWHNTSIKIQVKISHFKTQ